MTTTLDNHVVMLIRHAEKPSHAGGPHGITPDGDTDRHSLTVTGWTRAGALVGHRRLLAPPIDPLHRHTPGRRHPHPTPTVAR